MILRNLSTKIHSLVSKLTGVYFLYVCVILLKSDLYITVSYIFGSFSCTTGTNFIHIICVIFIFGESVRQNGVSYVISPILHIPLTNFAVFGKRYPLKISGMQRFKSSCQFRQCQRNRCKSLGFSPEKQFEMAT